MLAALAAGAFVVGLLGGVHCVGMCGGIATSLTRAAGSALPAWQIQAGYNIGRVGSYGLAGAIAGSIGGAGLLLDRLLPVQLAFYVIANVLLIGVGLYLGGWSHLVTRLEGPGRWLWRAIQPLHARLLPVDSLPRAMAVGALWGWLPCGLVYSLLATALLAGSAGGGALVMLAFGAGTLPNLIAAALVLDGFRKHVQGKALRQLAGAVVAGFGLIGLARAMDLGEQVRRGLLCLL